MAYLHGPHGRQNTAGSVVTALARAAAVVFGTAPVHNIEGFATNGSVNSPVLVNDFEEAERIFGYSEDWAAFSLCESMSYILEEKGVGPLVFINTFNPAVHKENTGGTKNLTPSDGIITIAGAELIVLDSVVIKTTGETPVTKVKGVDYSIAYERPTGTITVKELSSGALGTDALTITYDIAKPGAVDNAAFIGSTDGQGVNTGVYAIRNVWQLTGMYPSYMAAPGWSCIPAIHDAMFANSRQINGHWDLWMFTDIPIVDGVTPITLDSAYTWKKTNGYDKSNEKPSFPMIEGKDGKKYHLSTLRLANFLEGLIQNDGVPFNSDSNTPIPITKALWLGAEATGRVIDDAMIDEKLVKNGIAGAAYVGYWAIWGARPGDYDPDNATPANAFDTNMMMLMYCTNGFQARHFKDTDKPKSPNDIKSMALDEQDILNRLVGAGRLTYGKIDIRADEIAKSDMLMGDYVFSIEVSTTPLMNSVTADVYWTDKGYATYFASLADVE